MAGLIVAYGVTGIGKTLDICRCFRNGVVLLTDRDGLRAVQTLDHRTPLHIQLSDRKDPLDEVKSVIQQQVLPRVQARKVSAVIISSATELAERVLTAEQVHVKDARQAYQLVKTSFVTFVEDLVGLGVWIVFECQEAWPHEEDYRVRPGGPRFPGWQLMEAVIYRASIVLRAKYDTSGARVYQCVKNDELWAMKDRYNICKDEQPMNLLALMSAATAVKTA